MEDIMSVNLTTAQVQSFDDIVKQAYQGMGKLRVSVRVKTGVVGNTHRFTKIGKGTATPRVPQTDVTPMNIGYSTATATLTDWAAPEYTDIFNQQKVNFDEQRQLAMVIAGAITRREDQLILDAIDAASTSLTVSTDIGGTGSNLNTAKFRAAKKELDAGGVPPQDRYFVMHANNLYGLLGDSTATSVDYNAIKALVDGAIDTWLGFKTIMLETRTEGGLPLATGVRTCYAYHGGGMGAIGHAVGIDFKTEVNYIPEKTSFLANGLYSAGSVGIDAEGIVEISCTE
jgi:hypothetical protein